MSEIVNYTTYLNDDTSNTNYNTTYNATSINVPIKYPSKNYNKPLYYGVNTNQNITNSQNESVKEINSKKKF